MQSDWNYLKKTIQDVPNITSNLNQEVVKGKNQQREMTQHFNLFHHKKSERGNINEHQQRKDAACNG